MGFKSESQFHVSNTGAFFLFLAQFVECLTVERKVAVRFPGWTNTQGLKITEK